VTDRTVRLRELLELVAHLRSQNGCPWDREQTFASIAPYTIEEAYEVADAIEHGNSEDLRDELGDLLFQVMFLAQIASEAGQFDFDQVAGAICDKLIRRHPHVFGGQGHVTTAQQSAVWEAIKAQERNAARRRRMPSDTKAAANTEPAASALDGVPRAIPALMRAYKLSKRAARVGFDFDAAGQAAEKVSEELAEVLAAESAHSGQGPSPEIFQEVGDLLFAAANLARKLDVDAEAALRSANAKFERRFRGMESLAAQRGKIFADLDLEAQERLWQDVKRCE
jgi:nucleoside triphosphate diphosphatase